MTAFDLAPILAPVNAAEPGPMTDIDAIRQREQAATEGPWFYDSYSGVFSAPKVALYDPWLDTVDASHSMERHGRCDACGQDGCRLFSEAYNRDPLVAHVPAHHGDSAIGTHAADAAFIAQARTDIPALLAELDFVRAEAKSIYDTLKTIEKERDQMAAGLAEANAEVRSVTNQLTHTVNDLAEVRRQAHRDATNHQQIVRANTELAGERDALKAALGQPCGSCHPCTNYADETWRAAGRKPPHVFEYDELLAEVKALRPVADAAAAWRRFTGDDSVRFSEETALIAAVEALPNLQEPCDTCSSTAGGCAECRPVVTPGTVNA